MNEILTHNELVDVVSQAILKKYRDHFKDMFITNVSIDFPKPDFIYMPYRFVEMRKITPKKLKNLVSVDSGIMVPVAFELKPPYAMKHEYLTAIGQALAYTLVFPVSYLVIPEFSIREDFDGVQFVEKIITRHNLKIGIISYNSNNPNKVELIREAEPIYDTLDSDTVSAMITKIKRSYSYWRDTRPEEVYDVLKIVERVMLEKRESSSIMDDVFNRVWEEILSSRFSEASKNSYILNYKLFFVQNGLIDKNGKITALGLNLLLLGERLGSDSNEFRDLVTYVLLIYGGHYQVLSKIYKIQEAMKETMNDECLLDESKWLECIKTN
ncbi:hypothetical protein [Thermococcus sp. LS2]|uniref:hypothetical protein n=1 Tax=Thermococcus sp. LS2 TaxID=1638260 RepID=UPI00143A7D0C|nr:hypothetical protein [Thermococcus sp. LS2]NJE11822.1 hypothetical protein [Thermococcus sp. LS2]